MPPAAPRPAAGPSPSFAWTVVVAARQSAGHRRVRTPRPPRSSPRVRGRSPCGVTVTDNQNRVDAAEVIVEPNRATSAAPASAGNTPCATPVTSGPTPGAVPTPAPSPDSDARHPAAAAVEVVAVRSSLVTLFLLGALLPRSNAGARRVLHYFPLQLIGVALYSRRTPLTDQGLRYNYN